MSNLLQIEAAVLNLPQVKQGLNLAAISRAKTAEKNAAKKKLEKSIDLSRLVAAAQQWFESEEAKAIFAEEGLTWTTEDFAKKAFGWNKSFHYKLLRVSKVEQEVIDLFFAKCEEAEAEGHSAKRSIEELLKFAKRLQQQSEGSGEEEGEGSGEGEGEGEGTEPEVGINVPTTLTLAFKASELDCGRNVAIRVNKNGEVTTSNTEDEIRLALAYLQAALENANLLNG